MAKEDDDDADGGRARKRSMKLVKRDQLQNGQSFIKSLMSTNLTRVAGCADIQVLRNVFVWGGGRRNIVLTDQVIAFWNKCIEMSEEHRICAVGSPGVGKSTTTGYLIKLLVEDGKRVVYLRKAEKAAECWYYEWCVNDNDEIITKVYSGSEYSLDMIAGPDNRELFFLCDPGKTKSSCDPSDEYQGRVIIEASADSRHWGGSEFTKLRYEQQRTGELLMFPMMNKKQIFDASHLFENGDMEKSELEDRHRCFGNIPPLLFNLKVECDKYAKERKRAISSMTSHQVVQILDDLATLDACKPYSPPSSVICLTGAAPDFDEEKVSFVSDRVREEVAMLHLKNIWYAMSGEDNSSSRELLFEAYVRALMIGKKRMFRCRECFGKNDDKYKDYVTEKHGGCKRVVRSTDLAKDVREGPDKVVYYSYNERKPLANFIYKKGKVFVAGQMTISATHTCKVRELNALLRDLRLKKGETFQLLYFVPDRAFGEFVTKPVAPLADASVRGTVFIDHAEVHPPNHYL